MNFHTTTISITFELSTVHVIAKLVADSILDNNCKIPMDCSKFHVTHDVTILLSLMLVMKPQIKPLLMHITVGIVLAYLNCHTHIPFVVILTLLN